MCGGDSDLAHHRHIIGEAGHGVTDRLACGGEGDAEPVSLSSVRANRVEPSAGLLLCTEAGSIGDHAVVERVVGDCSEQRHQQLVVEAAGRSKDQAARTRWESGAIRPFNCHPGHLEAKTALEDKRDQSRLHRARVLALLDRCGYHAPGLLEVEVTAGMDDELGGGGVLRAHVVEPDGARGASATPPVVAGEAGFEARRVVRPGTERGDVGVAQRLEDAGHLLSLPDSAAVSCRQRRSKRISSSRGISPSTSASREEARNSANGSGSSMQVRNSPRSARGLR